MKSLLPWITVTVIIILALFSSVWLSRQVQAPSPSEVSNKENEEILPAITTDTLATLQSVSGDIEPISHTVRATIKTTKGDIEIELYGADAPRTVGNFVKLARTDFYDGTTFHRVIPNFMIQGGDIFSRDPAARAHHGTGGPGYTFADEINNRLLVRGSVAMANSGPHTNGSQFFIVTADATPHLDGKHTNFSSVVSGMDIVDAISAVETDEADNPIERVEIIDVVISE